ncbi:hypothetical protein [Ruegeria meonggei]|uniref:hypothetical protein n=1 Tax=Ruegeria meonggei TaxID=1446476 RepID=UPI00367236D1
MTHSFPIIFDPNREAPERTSPASIVVTPLDSFTRRMIQGPITAKLRDWGNKARRSASGHLVFERLTAGKTYTVEVDAERAGYFQPKPYNITVRADQKDPVPDAGRILTLTLRPDRVSDGEALIVRGEVVDASGERVAGQVLDAKVKLATETQVRPGALTFSTQTNARGNFAMRMRPPPVSLSTTPKFPLLVDVSFEIAGTEVWSGKVRDFTTLILDTAIVVP